MTNEGPQMKAYIKDGMMCLASGAVPSPAGPPLPLPPPPPPPARCTCPAAPAPAFTSGAAPSRRADGDPGSPPAVAACRRAAHVGPCTMCPTWRLKRPLHYRFVPQPHTPQHF